MSVGYMGSVSCQSGILFSEAGISSMALLPHGHPVKPPQDGLIVLSKSYLSGSMTSPQSCKSRTGLSQ